MVEGGKVEVKEIYFKVVGKFVFAFSAAASRVFCSFFSLMRRSEANSKMNASSILITLVKTLLKMEGIISRERSLPLLGHHE